MIFIFILTKKIGNLFLFYRYSHKIYKLMFYKHLLSFVLLLLFLLYSHQSNAQFGDCLNSQVIRQNSYTYPASAISNGSIPPINEFPTPAQDLLGNGCAGPSPASYWSFVQGQVWFYFKAANTGTICLSIDPINNSEDFDWVIVNKNGMTCADISSGIAPIVSCNASGALGTSGTTGLPGS